MLDAPLERWRVFLHPTQRKIVARHYNGPARVTGGAGTGKTVVAMHRAKWLAGQLEGDQKILFTTFTANLAEDIQDNLRKICSVDEMKRLRSSISIYGCSILARARFQLRHLRRRTTTMVCRHSPAGQSLTSDGILPDEWSE